MLAVFGCILTWDDPMAKIGNVGSVSPIWPQKPQDKLDPHQNSSRRKRTPSSEEDDADRKEQDHGEGHVDDYA